MNNFAEILRVQKYAKVTYYTLAINNDEPLFVQFEKKHNKENKEKLIHIMSWIHLIGNKYGASELYLEMNQKYQIRKRYRHRVSTESLVTLKLMKMERLVILRIICDCIV